MKTLLAIILSLLAVTSHAQVFPVQVSTHITPPYSPYLSDYTLPGGQNFTVNIVARDITLSDYPFKLRLTIEGPGITLRTKSSFTPPPLYLQGGALTTLYGDDLYQYLHPANLDFSGLPYSDYTQTARLPDGIYRFTMEVLDYNRGTVISNRGTTTVWVVLNDPPILMYPSNVSTVKLQDPTNILFSWTPRHTGSPNAAFTTEYLFQLVELWGEGQNPNDAFLTQSPLFETTTSLTQLLYTIAEPQLLPGRKYAWRVRARDANGKDLFKNRGYSEVYFFQYGEALPLPPNLRMRWAKPTTLAIQWDPVTTHDGDVRYRLQYRPRLRTDDQQWYETWTRFTDKTLYQLQSNTDYEMRIRAENAMQESDYSDIQVFSTLREEPDVFVCSDEIVPPPPPANDLPVFPLSINDTIHAGGYDVVVRDVMKVGSKYYGAGVAIVPWLNSAKVRVNFENIAVNASFWLTSGTIKSIWNNESSFIIEEQTPIMPGSAPQAGELDITVVSTDSLITFTGSAIVSVTLDEDSVIVVETTDGVRQSIPKGESIALTDEVGNGYVIDEKGNIAKTTAAEATATATRGSRDYTASVTFSRGSGVFGFDEKRFEDLSQYYGRLPDGSYVPWKALSSAEPDRLTAHLVSEELELSRIRFEVGTTSVHAGATGSKGAVDLQLAGRVAGMEEELLALYAPIDTMPPKVVGKVNLVTYNPIRYDLEIILVNDATLPGGLDGASIGNALNKIYRQAVVQWNVRVNPALRVPLPDAFDDGQTGLFSNYTDDMKAVLRAHGTYRDNTYYIFVIDEPRNASTLGYMPRNRQAGFVFAGPHEGNSAEFLKTIAHELGHGAFNLKHTFSEYTIPAGLTDNVMDYSEGTALYKYQWDHIHEPQVVIGLFEGGEESEMSVPDNFTVELLSGGITITYKGVTGTLSAFGIITSKEEIQLRIRRIDANPPLALGAKQSASTEVDALFARAATYLYDQISFHAFLTRSEIEKVVWSKQADIKAYLENLILDFEQSGLEDLAGLSTSENAELKNSIRKFREQQGIDPTVTVVDEKLFDFLSAQYASGEKSPSKDVHLLVDAKGKRYSFFYKAGFFTIPKDKVIIRDSITQTIQFDVNETELFQIRDRIIDTAIQNEHIEGIGKIDGPALNVFEKGMWVIKVTKETLAEVKVPVPMWNKSQSSTYPFGIESTIAGIGDGVVDEFKSIPDLLLMSLSLFDKAERDALVDAISSINFETLKGLFQDKIGRYQEGGYIARHEGGYDAVQVASTFWGGVALKSKRAADKVNNVVQVSKKLSKEVREKMNSLTDKQTRLLIRDLGKDPHLLARMTPDLLDAWKALSHSKIPDILRKNPDYLEIVSKQLTEYAGKVKFKFERVLPYIPPDDYGDFFKALNKPKSIDHVRSLGGDFEEIPGVSMSPYVSNSLPEVDIPAPSTWANPRLALPSETAITFTSATAKTLSPGQKIYRVMDPFQSKSGGFWTYELPKSKADLFGNTAVRPEWNGATHYVEYIVPEEGLKVWEGPIARQSILDGVEEVTLPGGNIQIFIPESYRVPGSLFDNLDLNTIDLQ